MKKDANSNFPSLEAIDRLKTCQHLLYGYLHSSDLDQRMAYNRKLSLCLNLIQQSEYKKPHHPDRLSLSVEVPRTRHIARG